jgi:hypothetical protein
LLASGTINYRYFVAFVLLFSFIAIIFANQIVLRDFPNSADEYSYIISAKIFALGKLSVPSPLHKEFYDTFNVVNDGKFYGK